MKDRGQRRQQEQALKRRMRNLWNNVWSGTRREGPPTDKWVGHMAATHGKPCSCYGCRNLRGTEGATRQEKRVFLDKLNELVQDETVEAIRREIKATTECDDPSCDCHYKTGPF